jgi:uncharacterized iron-regulated protein
MMHVLRVIIVTILLCPGLMFPGPMGAGAGRAADWPGQWVSEHGREHPLAGRILDVGAGRLIEPEAYLAALSKAAHVALGEIHDNADHHRLQAWVVQRLGGGAHAVVFEHFRADQQEILDAFVSGLEGAGAKGDDPVEKLFLVTNWADSGWPDKAIYAPLMRAVIDGRLPLLAGNPPRRRVMEVARGGLDAISSDAQRRLLLDRELGSGLGDALLDELEASHCGLMPKSAFVNMAAAQRFKDGFMARVMSDAAVAGQGTILIAGNGHVRLDRGVPWYLERMRPEGASQGIAAVAHVEVDPKRLDAQQYVEAGAYSYIVFTPIAERADPCEEMRKRFKKRSKE